MEPKKTEKADLTKKSGLFFNIGLVVALLIAVLAFEHKVADRSDVDDLARNNNIFEEIIEVPPTDQPPPPPPKVQQPQIVEVPDEEVIEEEIEIDMDNEITEETKVEVITIQPQEVEKEDPNAFYEYVAKAMQGKYPAQARRMGIEGRVFVEFVVEKDGSLTDVKAIKGIGAGCDELAVNVVKNAPKWKPGKQRGKPVRQKMVLPIVFKLN
jgi:protein TonB